MWNYCLAILDRIIVVFGALIFAQAPQFMEQYLHRLGGHIAELSHQVGAVQAVADQSGKTFQEYLHKLLMNGDADIRSQGIFVQNMLERFNDFSHSFTVLQNSSPLMKPILFIYHAKRSVFSDTIHSFSPGIPFTLEALIYGLLGMAFGYFLFACVSKGCRLLYNHKLAGHSVIK